MRNVIVLTGPTASGKTSLAIKLAKAYGGEIVGADSMQIYSGMDIATAKPTEQERTEIPHHLIDVVEPGEDFSVFRWYEEAKKAITGTHKRGHLPIVVGGTGQYISTLLHNINYTGEKSDPELRMRLEKEYDQSGGATMLAKLRKIDPEAAVKLHENDRSRILRGLELAETGLTKSRQNELSHGEKIYDICAVQLNFLSRETLYTRIDARVDEMFALGLEQEAQKIRPMLGPTSAQAIGYKELFAYFDGKQSLDEAKSRIKQATRNYAKRQLTWMRAEIGLNRIFADSGADLFGLSTKILQLCGIIC
ncbi:MAG TPA: tRNA (adenosine(37)-N6)-dimethylallyltransferase MiaA [Oscillospiraceae bacterium]|nr:tRNA (adenosine(37)-N6)-dimethylallyltransferase MiaA [Oscillospiraceae bacterium]HPF54903.1 tRNA (adenosine(37)-N6)-dimethylallyltransferase MiaA [Clostridiales bacterium]HPK34962.1 tRNA (adenosine(37)-N6)-dimethylallyltransferase MiaA [Oscillospiraceae bacterium]HPR75329.1 tRNA (adenosine(37)-N6)-dimethylallyltransferase MiaA [Oscillospiraceae bacterium]